MTIIWGKQVGLRSFQDPLSDAEIRRVYRWSRDLEVLRWSGGTPTELSFEEFAERLRGERGHRADDRRAFFIVDRESKLLGRLGCFAIDWAAKQGELGIVIGEKSPGATDTGATPSRPFCAISSIRRLWNASTSLPIPIICARNTALPRAAFATSERRAVFRRTLANTTAWKWRSRATNFENCSA